MEYSDETWHDNDKYCTTLYKRFPLRIASVNVTKCTVSCGSGHIYWRNPYWKTSYFCAVLLFTPLFNFFSEHFCNVKMFLVKLHWQLWMATLTQSNHNSLKHIKFIFSSYNLKLNGIWGLALKGLTLKCLVVTKKVTQGLLKYVWPFCCHQELKS